jgi:hypothetical protein
MTVNTIEVEIKRINGLAPNKKIFVPHKANQIKEYRIALFN